MKKALLSILIFLSILSQAQEISFQKSYSTGSGSTATAFTELRSFEFLIAYTWLNKNTQHTGPDVLEMHLMKTDRNGMKLWDKIIQLDTPMSETERFSTQSITELTDGNILVDVVYPFGEKYILKLDASGNIIWTSYLHNSFGDYDIYAQMIKQRSSNLAAPGGSGIVLGASYLGINPKATMTLVDAGGNAFDMYYYRGYFNDGYYLNDGHIYTTGVEQTDSSENLIFGDLRNDGIVNYYTRVPHKRNETVLTTAMFHYGDMFRIAESISKKDTGYYVNVYDLQINGIITSRRSYRVSCRVTNLALNNFETDWTISRKCQSYNLQSLEKISWNTGKTTFSLLNEFNDVMQLRQTHDAAYAFIFSTPEGIKFWKVNMGGSLQTGTAAEDQFAPNPVWDVTRLIPGADSYGKGMTITLGDMYGHIMGTYEFKPFEPVILDISHFALGTYGYRITYDDGTVKKGKLVKVTRR
jgi:hypothetical protein